MRMVQLASRRARTHLAFWLVLVLFPVSLVGSADVRTAQLLLHLVLGGFVVLALAWNLGSRPAKVPQPAASGFLAFLGITVGYFCLLTSLNPMGGSAGDLLDVARPMVYAAYFALPFAIRLSEPEVVWLLKVLLWIAVFQVLFSAAVYWPPLWPFVDIFKGRPSDDLVVFHFFRWSGTSGYPSDFAFLLSFFIYLIFFAPPRLMAPMLRWTLLALLSIGLVMTMSRGGIASAAVMIALGSVLFGRLRQFFVLAGLGALALTATIVVDHLVEEPTVNPGYVLELVEQGAEARSAQHRVHEIAMAADYSSRYFPFGAGAARDDIYGRIRVVESLYGHYLIKWGVLGLAAFLLSAAYFAWASWRCAFHAYEPWIQAFGRAFFLLTLSVPLVFGWSSAISDRFKGLPFYYVLGGYLALLVTARVGSLRPRQPVTSPPGRRL
jgi:hypothetical protein